MLRYIIRTERTQQILTDEQVEERPHIERNDQSQTATVPPIQEDTQSERRSSSTEQERRAQKRAKDKRKYEETKRCRKFKMAWKKSFPWVTLVNEKMFCTTCMNNRGYCDKESNFVKSGCGNFHIKALQTHGQSEGHKRCVEHKKAITAMPGTNPAEKALQALNKQNFDKMRTLFRIAHAIAKKGRPFSDYTWSVDLHETTTGTSLGETYRNNQACSDFVGYIAEAERLAMAQEIAKAPFYSVLTDGSTDSSIREAEVMFLRHSNKGKISNNFLALKNVIRANAENVTELIVKTLKDYGGFTDATVNDKMVGFGADGASVNMGRHNGIGARLRRNQPLLSSIHCMAHRLELAFKQVIRGNASQMKVLTFLENMYKFYRNSSLNRSMLRECSAALGATGIPTRLGGIRWIPHTYTALVNFWKLYQSLLQHFEQVIIKVNIKISKTIVQTSETTVVLFSS